MWVMVNKDNLHPSSCHHLTPAHFRHLLCSSPHLSCCPSYLSPLALCSSFSSLFSTICPGPSASRQTRLFTWRMYEIDDAFASGYDIDLPLNLMILKTDGFWSLYVHPIDICGPTESSPETTEFWSKLGSSNSSTPSTRVKAYKPLCFLPDPDSIVSHQK